MTQITEIASTRLATADLTESEHHRLLANERRRAVLATLDDRAASVDLDDLAAQVATQEGDEADTDQIKITLHHVHLPKLADAGVIEYDPETHRIDQSRSPSSTPTGTDA